MHLQFLLKLFVTIQKVAFFLITVKILNSYLYFTKKSEYVQALYQRENRYSSGSVWIFRYSFCLCSSLSSLSSFSVSIRNDGL